MTAPSCKMGSSTRADYDRNRLRACNFPPPDTYNPLFQTTRERQASWSFGSSQRANFGAVGLKTPAPGTYNTEKKSTEGPKYAMGLKLDENSLIEQERRCQRGKPGPGAYNPDYAKLVHSSGGFSLKGKISMKEENRAPGPGAYKASESVAKQSFKFPSSP